MIELSVVTIRYPTLIRDGSYILTKLNVQLLQAYESLINRNRMLTENKLIFCHRDIYTKELHYNMDEWRQYLRPFIT